MIILLLFHSCRKPIPSELNISASGFVSDTVKNKVLKSATVEVGGLHLTFYGLSGGDSITSTLTDKNGFFNLNFITDGKYYAYRIVVKPMPNDIYVSDNSRNSVADLKIGNNPNLHLKARELNYLKERIIVNQNPYDTLHIYNSYDGFKFYNHHQFDTTLLFKVLPMATNYFYYYTWDSKLGRERWQSDTLRIEMADTTYYTKNINKLELKLNY